MRAAGMLPAALALLDLWVLAGCAHKVIAPAPPPAPPLFAIATGNPGIPLCGSSPPPCLQGYTVDENGLIVHLAITVTSWQAAKAGIYVFRVNMLGASGKTIASPPAVAP